MGDSSEMSLAAVQKLINTYDTLDREDCKAAMVKVAIACNTHGATAIVAANELQDLSMEKGQALFGLSKMERKLIEQNAKFIIGTYHAASYARKKVNRLAALHQMCPELQNNHGLPQDPVRLKELNDLIQKCGHQLACCFLRDAMYRRFQTLVGNGRHRSDVFPRLNAKDIIWAAKQSQLHGKPAPDTPAVLFEQRDGMPHFVCDRPYDLRKLLGKALPEQAAGSAVGAANTSNPGTLQLRSAVTDGRAVDTTARGHDSDVNETPFVFKPPRTRKQPARKVCATVNPTRTATETPLLYRIGKGRNKRPATPPESVPSPKRQAVHSPSATSQEQLAYTHPSAPTPSPITPAITRPQLPPAELMPPPQKQRSHTLSLPPEHAQSRSGAPTPSSIMPQVAKPDILHY
ncbi:hypothetical protein LTR56_006244 [Elasticomyces elasticus]|nr:hypothetical protein LTR56_006244 [Elasticomyces elasticus]KAK3666547.1 hypothetical protein LTR22_002491 [Elasticomyces elasticus]KAK4928320.1 hypothetical protein LTR49_004997 [Elasticomyces elasticus]KAK5763883.1 hypothetical protein LTS12_006001 [Elasticomyces elasticus]